MSCDTIKLPFWDLGQPSWHLVIFDFIIKTSEKGCNDSKLAGNY